MGKISNDKIKEAVDSYLKYALTIDLIVVVIIFVLNIYLPFIAISFKSKEDYLNVLDNTISASVSLAGFILASLTIIVAIRSNIANKTPEQAKNPLELFFSTNVYKSIVKVFQIAITELIICFISAYIIWIISSNISEVIIFNCLVAIIFLMSASTIRSLFVMFLLIGGENRASH